MCASAPRNPSGLSAAAAAVFARDGAEAAGAGGAQGPPAAALAPGVLPTSVPLPRAYFVSKVYCSVENDKRLTFPLAKMR